MIRQNDKKALLKLSRKALEYRLEKGLELDPSTQTIPEILKQKGATFVTLTKGGELRGCIGKLIAVHPIYIDAVENTYSAAFHDYRFSPVIKDELNEITIEISVLSKPNKLSFDSTDDLCTKIFKEKCGVVLSSGFQSATYLPQVWEQFDSPKKFLSSLCEKAGLNENHWRFHRINIETYTVDKFSEADFTR